MNSAAHTASGSRQVQKPDRGPPVSNSGWGTRHRAWFHRSGKTPRTASLSLSPSPIKRVMSAEASLLVALLPNTEVRTLLRSLLASRRLASPLGDSSHIANPRFFVLLLPWVSASPANSSAVHHRSHGWPPPSPVSFLLHVPRRGQCLA
jgi:hypothetical protein